jgi:hypothetical protein
MIAEDFRTTASWNLVELRRCEERLKLREEHIQTLLGDKAGLEKDLDRLMMEGEDIYA